MTPAQQRAAVQAMGLADLHGAERINGVIGMLRDSAFNLATYRAEAIRVGTYYDDLQDRELTRAEFAAIRACLAYATASLMLGVVDSIIVAEQNHARDLEEQTGLDEEEE